MSVRLKTFVIMAGALLAAGYLALIATTNLSLAHLRVGGSVYKELKQHFDMTADIMPPSEYVVEPFLEATLELHDGDATDHGARLKKLRAAYESRKAFWASQPLNAKARALLGKAQQNADSFWQVIDQEFQPAVARGDTATARDGYELLKLYYTNHRTAIDALVAHERLALAAGQQSAERQNVLYLALAWGTSALVMLVLGAVLFVLLKRILAPLLELAKATRKLADGDLATHIPGAERSDELGDLASAMNEFRSKLADTERSKAEQTEVIVASIGAGLHWLAKGDLTHRISADLTGPFVKLKQDFNTAMARLQKTLEEVMSSTDQIAGGASEISQAADDLSRRTEQQAANLEETAAAFEEITAAVKKTAANAKGARGRVVTAEAAADEGGRVVGSAIAAMGSIAQSSQQIADIIGVIDEIAFQTNLLALNAGVEAARAGDAGRGFAVVASEVRELAGRSGQAAKQIKALISEAGNHVQTGVKLVNESGTALKRIIEQVQQINSLIGEMAQAAEQQSAGIEQVHSAVNQMDQITQQNAAIVEESTAASHKLAGETQELQQLVSFFRVDGTGHEAVPEARARPRAA